MNNVTDKQTSGTIWQVAKAVMFAFMGIRKKSDLEKDAATLKPVQLIIGGIIGGALFVIGVMLLVRLVVS
ncbi:MAG: DUF2970 domain-containing protein [Nitrosomonas sp.]|uniref:DUF2970 domain-containing protein n=1 Tax=Nitrosomonas oligotropha TaxID=42354 RepID=A0A5C7VM91_9PROT|nr:DUF2970 domain-containing protein [Nitrosomonas oligotropha]MBK7490780.1 DUF2970 domain-containing protein [Nitrosomonas sp.]MBP9099935.1 DUF2970 domain-containing protein [Nitrosomonas sp.]TXI26806.1 MAG: DUF2970 domain-containing protein [Nitrosomonas oligotropha]